MTGTTFKDIFQNEETFYKTVRDFDPEANHGNLIVPLVPWYGPSKPATVQRFSPEVKIMIAAVAKTLMKIEPEGRYFDTVLGELMREPFLRLYEAKCNHRSDVFPENSLLPVRFDGSLDSDLVKKVDQWFSELLDDQILTAHFFPRSELAKFLLHTRPVRDRPHNDIYQVDGYGNEFDVGILKFPTEDYSRFELCRVKLSAWSRLERLPGAQEREMGLHGECIVRAFRPNPETIINLPDREDFNRRAENFVAALFETTPIYSAPRELSDNDRKPTSGPEWPLPATFEKVGRIDSALLPALSKK